MFLLLPLAVSLSLITRHSTVDISEIRPPSWSKSHADWNSGAVQLKTSQILSHPWRKKQLSWIEKYFGWKNDGNWSILKNIEKFQFLFDKIYHISLHQHHLPLFEDDKKPGLWLWWQLHRKSDVEFLDILGCWLRVGQNSYLSEECDGMSGYSTQVARTGNTLTEKPITASIWVLNFLSLFLLQASWCSLYE